LNIHVLKGFLFMTMPPVCLSRILHYQFSSW